MIFNYFIICPVYLIVCTCLLIWILINSQGLSSLFIGGTSGVMIAVIILMGIRYIQFLKVYYSELKIDDRHTTYKFTEKEIEYDNNKNRKVFVAWESFQCMRTLKNGIFFIPKEKTGILVGLPIENLDSIIEFITENKIEIKRLS